MGFNQDSIFPSDSFNPFSILSSMQIGSNTITNVDWSSTSDCDNGFSWRRKYYQDYGQPYSNNTSAQTSSLFQ